MSAREVNCFNRSLITEKSSVLLVIAHPDDEAMFFVPFLHTCATLQCQISILCLSEGNYYGLGKIRRKEMFQSALKLGVSIEDVIVLDDNALQDGPNNHWSPECICEHVMRAVDIFKVDVLVTFDSYGISGMFILLLLLFYCHE